MQPEIVFSIVNFAALAGWILLVCLPRWSGTRKIVLSGAVSLLLAIAYLILIILFFGRAEGGSLPPGDPHHRAVHDRVDVRADPCPDARTRRRVAADGPRPRAEVMRLFTNQWVVLAGWIHYLAFDLFVGGWEVRDSQARGISHWFVIPCLILTFLLGPIGFLLYHIVRLAAPHKNAGGETP